MYAKLVLVSLFCASTSAIDAYKHEKRQAIYHHQPNYEIHQFNLPLRQKEREERQDLNRVPGIAGVDFPIYHRVPPTSFDCRHAPAVPGMYADPETGCQAYHVCQADRDGYNGGSFLCTNGTLFNQKEFTCDWWYNVNCHEQPSFYSLNLDPVKNPFAPKPQRVEEEPHVQHFVGPQVTYRGSPIF